MWMLIACAMSVIAMPPDRVEGLSLATGPIQEYLFTQGKRHYDSGDADAAARVWKDIFPDSLYGPVAYVLLGRAYRGANRHDVAANMFRDLIQSHPGTVYDDIARRALAKGLCEQAKPEAVTLLNPLIQKAQDKEKPSLIFRLAELERRLGRHAEAAESYRKLVLEYPASVEGLKAGEALAWMVVHGKATRPEYTEAQQLQRADRLFAAGRFDLAGEAYRSLLKTRPEDNGLLIKLARCHYKDRQNIAALNLLHEVLKKDLAAQQKAEALYLLSLLSWRLNREKEFESVCEQILKDPASKYKTRVLYNLASYHLEKKRFPKAEEYFQRVLKTSAELSVKAKVKWKTAWIYYLQKNYKKAAETFREIRSLAKGGGMEEASRYWQARSLLNLNRPKEAEPLLTEIVRDAPLQYYAFEAARELKAMHAAIGKENRTPKAFPDVTLTAAQKLDPHVAAATKLLEMELPEFALLNLEALPAATRSAPSIAFLAARTAYAAGRYVTARKLLYDNFGPFMEDPPPTAPPEFVEIAFPRVHRIETTRCARKHSIDPHLVWSIIRQESRYDPTAVSPAGALGLMQVTPEAAGYVGKDGKLPAKAVAEILQPEKNIALGTQILAKNLRSFKGNLVHAVASYNADIRKVKEWVRKNGKMKQDEFIETIPYLETRIYVKKVLGGYRAYSTVHSKKDLAGLR